MIRRFDRRDFLRSAGGAGLLAAGCRSRRTGGRIVLRLSHSMTAGPTSLHTLGDGFRELAEAATGGAVEVRVFPSGTLGQEREVVQQLQEGLVDFMCSGTAIWGSVAPKLQVFDFPFLWRDWDHVHGVVDGRVGRRRRRLHGGRGRRAAARLGRLVRLPAGRHALAGRERAGPAAGPEDPDDPVADLRQGGRADGREPDADGLRRGLHVAPDRCDRRLRARREHDAPAALLRGRALHGAHAPHRRRARALGLGARTAASCRADLRPKLEAAALEAARRQRASGSSRRTARRPRASRLRA